MDGDKKLIFIFGILTVAIIGAGVFFFSKGQDNSPKPEQTASQELLVKPDSHKIQAPNEKAVLVEFGDFQCPACGTYAPLVKKLTEEYKDNLSLVFRNFPLQQHKNARPAAYAAEAAGMQGKYWEMFDKIYEEQSKWSDSSNAEALFEDFAISLGLDLKKYKEDVKSSEIRKRVDDDFADGAILNVDSTPTFFLNGSKIANPKSYEDFATLVKAAFLNSNVSITGEEKYHAHFDFKLVVNGKVFDFTKAKYQESKDNPLDHDVHFHDGNGKVVHLHKKGVTLDQFLKSIDFALTDKCITTDTKALYCNKEEAGVSLFVNGEPKAEFEKYIPQDLDRILITYGTDVQSELQKQIDSVSNDACIYSEKCPERGAPPEEECVGGLGSGCD